MLSNHHTSYTQGQDGENLQQIQAFLLCFTLRQALAKLPRLDPNSESPCLSHLSIWDYRCASTHLVMEILSNRHTRELSHSLASLAVSCYSFGDLAELSGMIPSPWVYRKTNGDTGMSGQRANSSECGGWNPERVSMPLHQHTPRWAAALSHSLGHIIAHPKSNLVSTMKKSCSCLQRDGVWMQEQPG